ncbi:hypothetical protein L0128_07640, partial [candidate division KSB1 bacterium]|nr:hypothetical protein [candidate division KSB1 bacterium]
HLGIDLNYTFMDPQDLTLNQALAYRPRHLATAAFSFNFGMVTLDVDYSYGSRHEAVLLYPGDDRVPKKILDAKISLEWKNYQLAFDVDNALQYHYVPVERNLAPLRKYQVSLSATY